MQKVKSAFRNLVGSRSRETEPILGGHERTSPYISITDSGASTSCNSSEESGSVVCPSCRGTGRIPRGQERELVALIPYSDNRLKPRRTKCYVITSIVTCIVIFIIGGYFMYPRSITLEHAGVNSSLVTFDAPSVTINLFTTNILNVTNKNYFGIVIRKMKVEVLHMSVVVGTFTMEKSKTIHASVTEQIFYLVESVVHDKNTFDVCTWAGIRVHNILLLLQGTVYYTYFGRSEQVQLEGYEYLDCHNNSTIPH